MGSRKCMNTINLAKIPLQALKEQESKLQQLPAKVESNLKCKPIPPPPRLIRYKAIQIRQTQPVAFMHPAIPCICPPCRICLTKTERLHLLLKTIGKAYVLYFAFELINSGEYWGNADASANLVTSISNLFLQLFGIKELYSGHKIGFFQIDRIKHNFLTYWNKLVFMTFWYSVGLPTHHYQNMVKELNKAIFCDVVDDTPTEEDLKKELEEKEEAKKRRAESKRRASQLE